MAPVKVELVKEFILACEARGFDPLAVIANHRESEDRVLHTIRPNDLAPDISQFQQVTDELKPKVRDGSG